MSGLFLFQKKIHAYNKPHNPTPKPHNKKNQAPFSKYIWRDSAPTAPKKPPTPPLHIVVGTRGHYQILTIEQNATLVQSADSPSLSTFSGNPITILSINLSSFSIDCSRPLSSTICAGSL